jgi:hypothetical protein
MTIVSGTEFLIKVTPVLDEKVRGSCKVCWPGCQQPCCRRPYPGHRKGCPNWSDINHPDCPPYCKPIGEIINLSSPVYAIYNRFPIGEHAARMKTLHPNWTDRQLYNCLYWQPRARQSLLAKIRDFWRWALGQGIPSGGYRIISCPEGHGVNVTATMQAAGIILEWPPREIAYQIVLAGERLSNASDNLPGELAL